MPVKLDARLSAIAALVPPGLSVADIGTDHGYLPAYLAEQGHYPSIIASDVACGPLASARQLFSQLKLEGAISLRQGDGLRVLKPNEVQALVMAGMGGQLICHLLAACPEVVSTSNRLILQPQKNARELRLFLQQMGWRIVDERLARDKDLYYQVIAAEPGQMCLNEIEAKYGCCLLRDKHPLTGEWLSYLLIQNRQLQAELAAQGNLAWRINQLREEESELRKLIELFGPNLEEY